MNSERRPFDMVARIQEHGYAIRPGFLQHEELDAVHAAACQLAASADARHYPKSTRVWDLYRHDALFVDLLDNAELTTTLTELLGEHYLLSDYSLNTINPEQPADDWHIDYPYNEMRTFWEGPILGGHCILTLDDFHRENGATLLVPDTHHRPRRPDPYFADVHHETFVAGAGTRLILAAATWHRSGVNHTTQPRTAVLLSFVPRWIRPMTDPPEPGPWATTEALRIRLGIRRPPETINGIPI